MKTKEDTGSSPCSKSEICSIIKSEREQAIENLRAHLSEQRHDFFNLLQVIYGYTQLKKTDKVLEHIRNYSSKLENMGRVYNSKCIKLADLLYNKEKEAESVDLNFEVSVEISFDPVIRMLEDENIINGIDSIITAYFYMLCENGHKDATVVYSLKESADDFTMEIYCKEVRRGDIEAFPFRPEDKKNYWSKISGNVESLKSILELCKNAGIEAKWAEVDSTFTVRIYKCL